MHQSLNSWAFFGRCYPHVPSISGLQPVLCLILLQDLLAILDGLSSATSPGND